MNFTNDATDTRLLLATDYWESPEALAGKPILSYSGRCFRMLCPVRSVIGPERYAPISNLMIQIEECRFPIIQADQILVSVETGEMTTFFNWSDVYGITCQEFPDDSESCDFAIYVYAGKRGPRLAFRRKATMQGPPF